MAEFFTIVANFGFPVAVASYLLFRFEKKLELLENTNDDLVVEIKSLKEKVAELSGIIKELKK
jgi:hypothetical protein